MMLILLLIENTCHIPLIRVYCPRIPGVEMLTTRITLALGGGLEAEIMNNITLTMETTT